jgi:protein SCO1/2
LLKETGLSYKNIAAQKPGFDRHTRRHIAIEFLYSGMKRRDLLRAAGTIGLVGSLAGCSENSTAESESTSDNEDVVLAEPDRDFESDDLPYPAWGERIPDVTLPAPLADTSVSLRNVETPSLLTFFYSNCQTVCPVLIGTLRNVQAHATNNDYTDAVAIQPISFDPQRDTANRLETYAGEMNVDAAAPSWQFLRPESKARAKSVVQGQFGVRFERTRPEDMDMYMFTHASLTLLVNADGFVERAYRSKSPDEQRIIDDLREVRQA